MLRARLGVELLLLDCTVIASGMLLGSFVHSGRHLFNGSQLATMTLVSYLGIALAANAYGAESLSRPRLGLKRAVTSLLYALIAVIFFTYVAHASEQVSRIAFTSGSVFALVFLSAARLYFFRWCLKRSNGAFHNELLIVDEVESPALAVEHRLDAPARGLIPDLSNPAMLHLIGTELKGFDRVIVACPPDRRHAWATLLRGANIDGELLLPDRTTIDVIGIGHVGGHSTYLVSRGPLSMSNRVVKRMFDLLLTVPALIGLAPLLGLIAIAIKLDSRGPVFFRQERVGRGNQLFKILKFRTMRAEACDAQGNRSASRDDDRITTVGRLLRRTSLDELPQLWNVLEGDMSMVGPRPHALGSLAGNKLFWEIDHEYWVRHALKPGITGLAQVRGLRGATDQRQDLERRLAADLEYLDNWSILRDIGIVSQTALVLVHSKAF